MKKVLKSRIFSFILGLIVMAGIAGVYAINASEIDYRDTKLDQALDDLYNHTDVTLRPVLLWTNPNPTADFAAQVISLDLSEYKYVAIVTASTKSQEWYPRSTTVLPVMDNYTGYEPTAIGAAGTRATRFTRVYKDSIDIGATQTDYGTTQNTIPYKIYGIKGELGIDIGIDE